MSSIGHHRPPVVRPLVVVAATIGVVVLGAAPSSARPDPGPPIRVADRGGCLLQRVDTQFVRCDDLTGNGTPAPDFIAQR